MARKGNIGEVKFEIAHVSSSDEELTKERLARSLKSEQGWTSAQNCSYPQEVILVLTERTNVVKVQVKSHPVFLSQKVDFHLATVDGVQDLSFKPNVCRAANFVRAGMVAFTRDTRYNHERKTIYMDKSGAILKITIHGNYKTDRNPYNQVGIGLLSIHGYSEPIRSLKKVESAPSLLNRRQLSSPSINARHGEGVDRKTSYNPQRPPLFPPLPQHRSFDSTSSLSSSYSISHSESRTSSRDPILELQTLQRILNRKKEESVDSDKMVLARMCGAAVERLQKAEGEVEFYGRKKREAGLSGGDSAEIAELERKMIEVKEQVVKAIHLELILEQKEIDSIEALNRERPPPEPLPSHPSPTPQLHPQYPPPYYPYPPPYHRCHHSHPPESDSDSSLDSVDSRDNGYSTKTGTVPEPYCDDICCNPNSTRGTPGERSWEPSRQPSPTRTTTSTRSSSASRNPTQGKDNLPPKCSGREKESKLYFRTCPFCLETNDGFEKQNKLNAHYTERCPVMIKCPYCGRVVEVKNFDSHKMKSCAMIKDQTSPCPICGQACTEGQIEEHKDGIGCPGRKPTVGTKWCPLCNVEVQDRDAAWRDHLMTDIEGACTGNNRKGLSGYPEKEKKPKTKKESKKSKKSKKPKDKKPKNKEKKKPKPAEEEKNVFM